MTQRRIDRARPAARGGLGLLAGLSAFALALFGASGVTQDAVANGDTRTITVRNDRTQEDAAITFKRNGTYVAEGLKQLDWILRDWRTDEPTRMDPKLFDILWQVYREVGAGEPIHILSAYRSPGTNAMLRRRSRAVSEHSQHMRGKAIDFRIPDVSMARVREIGMRLQQGGVGFYPGASFVHLDAGSVRSWPRMSGGELARLFPDGRTVHIPREGRPLDGYEEAKAMILARGGSVAGYSAYAEGEEPTTQRKSLWATLFGGGEDEDAEFYRSTASRTRTAAATPRRTQVAAYAPAAAVGGEDAGTRGFFGGGAAPLPEEPVATVGRGRRSRTQMASVATPSSPLSGPPPGFEASAPPLLAGTPTLSEADSDPAPAKVRMLAAAPVPPRRPDEMALLVAGAPLPPLRPTVLASVGGSAPVLATQLRGEMAAPSRAAAAAADEKAALRALFDTVATSRMPARRADVPTTRARPEPITIAAILDDPGARVRMEFTSGASDGPEPGAFTGPAVAPLPILR